MFREMRRKKQMLLQEECVEILEKGTSGVLALSGDDNYPYALPISYVYKNNKIYFHGAKTGHKIDAIANNNKVSFCVINQDKIIPEKFTTYYRSVIVFGKARIIEDDDEKRRTVDMLAIKYSPKESKESREKEIDSCFKGLCMIELNIEHITGKESLGLIKERENKVKEQ